MLKVEKFSVNLPFGIGGVEIACTEGQQRASWALYVEYETRITTQALLPGEGSAREALTSLHSMFDITRTVLKEQGPEVAEGPDSIGPLAIRILNEGVRPFLVRWHTRLGEFEAQEALCQNPGPGRQPIIDESKWKDINEFYAALEAFQEDMREYVRALAELTGLTAKDEDEPE